MTITALTFSARPTFAFSPIDHASAPSIRSNDSFQA